MKAAPLALALLAALTACSAPPDEGAVVASMIGDGLRIVDPSQKPLAPPAALLLAATAQGLVRFDAAGQIEPGLAIRWDVSDDGLFYTFRLADTATIDAERTARWLRAAIGPTSRNPLKPVLGAIAEIVAVTPEVIEIRLASPRPDLLSLLAQPELAILADGVGTGPFTITARDGTSVRLGLIDRRLDADPEQVARRAVTLRAERAARAVARFRQGRAALVLGGRFTDLAVARAAALPAASLHVDPANGLFGLVAASRTGFVAVADNRRALAMAIDRARIASVFGAGWRAASAILPAGLPDRTTPATPDWIDTPPERRRTIARDVVAGWTAAHGEAPIVRLAMPEGPGGRALFALLQADWRVIGVSAVAAGAGEAADLALVDLVAPGVSASWYLRRFECVRSPACSVAADAALAAARTAPTIAERSARLAEADARLTETSAFIPIAQPLRWSLVAPRLTRFQDNARAAHPLDQLRGE